MGGSDDAVNFAEPGGHAGPNCIPVLTCQLQQGLLAQGEHLTSRCQGWTDDLARQRGWAPEGA